MPKVHNTRKEKAAELWKLINNGPHFSLLATYNADEASSQAKSWLEAWVVPLVLELVPELRRKK